MRRVAWILVLLLALPAAAVAQGLLRSGLSVGPGEQCRQAIQAAERAHGIPAGLLAAMGQVESGRPDPRSGKVLPWPWTINIAGQGAFFDTEAEAIAAVRASQERGTRSIDVGCLQVNLKHHPHAFASLRQAFDPASNAAYAAGFLRELFAQTGSWPRAAALYHSATPELGADYRRQVMAAWPDEMRRGVAAPGLSLAAARPVAVSRRAPSVRRAMAARIPPGWHLAPQLAVAAATPGPAACPFAALVGCRRIYPKASR